jgi:hypothetical protein
MVKFSTLVGSSLSQTSLKKIRKMNTLAFSAAAQKKIKKSFQTLASAFINLGQTLPPLYE